MQNSLGSMIEGYLEYCVNFKKLSRGTVKDIRCTLNRLRIYCGEEGTRKEIWSLTLEEYIRWINQCRAKGQTPKHINKSLSHLRGLINYAWNLELVDRNVLDKYHLQDANHRKEVEIPTVEELRELMGAFGVANKEERRKRMILLILYGCGLRNSELCGLNVQDIDHERREIKVSGKGSKERVIPLMDGLFTELLAYLSDRRSSRGALFKTLVKKKRIRVPDVIEVVREAVKSTSIEKKIMPKTLRHAFASHLAEQGVDIAVIAKLMGHRTPRETSTYLHADKSRLKLVRFENIEREGAKV